LNSPVIRTSKPSGVGVCGVESSADTTAAATAATSTAVNVETVGPIERLTAADSSTITSDSATATTTAAATSAIPQMPVQTVMLRPSFSRNSAYYYSAAQRLNTTACSPPSKRLKETISFDSILPDRSNSNSIDNLSVPLSHTMIGKSKFRALTRIGLLRLSLDCVEFPFDNSSDGHNGSSDSVHREASLAYIRIPHKIVTVTYFATKPLAFIGYRPTDKAECARICQQAGLPEDYLCCATTGARRWVIGLVAEDKSDADPLVSNIQQLIHWYERAGSQLCVRIMKLNDVSGRSVLHDCDPQLLLAMTPSPTTTAAELTTTTTTTTAATAITSPAEKAEDTAKTAISSEATTLGTTDSSAVIVVSEASNAVIPVSSVASSAAATPTLRLHPPSLQQQQQQQQARRIVFIRTQASPSLSQPTQPAQAQLSLSSVQTVRIIISPSAAATSKAITLPTLVPQPPPPPPPPLIEKFTYRPGGSNGITITDTDLACLRSGNYLNDVIIDFYLKYILHELLTPEQRARTHLFNSFFYKRLAHCAGIEAAEAAAAAVAVDASIAAERRHASVAKWTRKVDLFSKDFIIIPINENYHWFLVVICFPMLAGCVDYNDMLNAERAAQTEATTGPNGTTAESTAPSNSSQDQAPQPLPAGAVRSDDGTLQLPCVLVFDSLSGTAHRGPNVKIIREYLQVEWDIKKRAGLGPKRFDKGTMRGFSPHVPQQPNFVDCGPYVLHYAEMFYKRPIPEFTKAYFQEHMRNWFNNAEIQNKRAEMQQLIVQLYRKLGPDKPHCGGDDDPIEESEVVTAACQTESCRS
ncbi:hypothetical protein BOX15_Mlig023450g2, partial [Macrostomum lignano]